MGGMSDSIKLESNKHFEKVFEKIIEQSTIVFKPQLKALGLSKEQIEKQNLDELKESLELINEAINKPESFGTIGFGIQADANLYVTKAKSSTNIHEVGILPILLERKKLILSRISSFKGKRKNKASELLELIKGIEQEDIKSKLENEVKELNEISDIQVQLDEVEQAQKKEELKTFEDIARRRQEAEIFEQRSKVFLKFLEKESATTIIGAVLLLMITLTLIIAMFLSKETTDILNNAFLLILGYFFGQTVSKSAKKTDE